MRVITFQPRFQTAVATGTKRQTIRARAGCKPGDELSLRKWRGKPYRSIQIPLRPTVRCTNVSRIRIAVENDRLSIIRAGRPLMYPDDLARTDGFADANDMRAWFESTHELPFEGDLIEWE